MGDGGREGWGAKTDYVEPSAGQMRVVLEGFSAASPLETQSDIAWQGQAWMRQTT